MRHRGVIALVTGAVLLTMLLGACTAGPGAPGPKGEPGQSLNWADTIEDANLADSIYAIGMRAPGATLCLVLFEDCEGSESAEELGDLFFLVGTGFVAHYPNTIWTNAHVALALRSILETIDDADEPPPYVPVPVAVRAGTAVGGVHTHRLNIDTVRVHPGYEEESPGPDLAVFQVDDLPTRDVPSFLPRSFATELRVGQPVGTLGFPGELTLPFGVVPIATFKEGTISALRPYLPDETEVTPQNSKVVQFNLGQTGGTSGSPVFDHQGFIVAVSNAGIVEIVVDPEGAPTAIPIGDLDFGVRVDEVWTLIDLIEAATEPPAEGARGYPYPAYRAYPDGWNGRTASP